jgi:hypothetical protein
MKRVSFDRLKSLSLNIKKKMGEEYLCFTNYDEKFRNYHFVVYKKNPKGNEVIFQTKEGMNARECYYLLFGWYMASDILLSKK